MADIVTTTPRTQAEIAARALELTKRELFPFGVEALAEFLTFEAAREGGLLRPDANPDTWTDPHPANRDGALAVMREYMPFAWEKASDHRGISANRSVAKMSEWAWVAGDDEAVAFCADAANYPNYGAPILAYLCARYGFPVPDDARIARMARGAGCRDDCDAGCGT